MEYYSVMKRSEVLLHVTTWINLENIMRVKEAIHKRSYTAHFHLYGITRTSKSIETESARLSGMGERRLSMLLLSE